MDDLSRAAPPGFTINIEQRLDELQRLHPRVIDLSLGRIERLLAALGNPEHRLPPVIHIAGTNGKGSTLAVLRACLEAADQRVHTYTSPHLMRFNERIGLAGADIGDDALLGLIDRVEAANQGEPITYFEITTAIAYLAYAEHPADWLLLETGLGGRLDATNVIDRPALSVITPVSIDHQSYLGDTLEEIAAEKAGIFKPGVPAVIAPQSDVVLKVLESAAAASDTPLFAAGRNWNVAGGEAGLCYRGRRWTIDLPLPSLQGHHQTVNATTAVACLDILDVPGVVEETIVAGFGEAVWPGRLQRVSSLGSACVAGWHFWVDGGHNGAAAAALAVWAADQPGPVWLVAAMLGNRDISEFLGPFAGAVRGVVGVCGPDGHDWHAPKAIADAANRLGLQHYTAATIEVAAALAAQQSPTGTLLVTGSLYLVGDVLARYGPRDTV